MRCIQGKPGQLASDRAGTPLICDAEMLLGSDLTDEVRVIIEASYTGNPIPTTP